MVGSCRSGIVWWWVEGAGRSVAGLDGAGGSRSAGGLSRSSLGAVPVGGRVAGAVCVINPWKTE